jgi:hypothetical protein
MSVLMTAEQLIPEYALDALVPEADFERAYGVVPAPRLGLLKRCIAQLFAWYGRRTELEERSETLHGLGLRSFSASRPMDWTLLAAGEELDSPVQLLAALLPPLLSGVRQVLVVRTADTSHWSPSLLAAMELAGVEAVFSSPDRDFLPRLVQDLSRNGARGKVISFGGVPPCSDRALPRVPHAVLESVQRLGLWSEGGVAWDLPALLFGTPRAEVVHCSPGGAGGSTAPAVETSWPEFLGMGFGAVLVPEERIEGALGRVPLVLGPGQECFWVWPSLHIESFMTRSAGFCDAQMEP